MAKKIIKQTSSFGVLRANPRISGNVKLTVDSASGIWLNSIDSNPEMSNSAYKVFSVSPDSSYDNDLFRFFKEGKTPPQFVFGLIGEEESVQNQTSDLSSVYNFFYSSGVAPLISDKYSEDFSYLAPLWLGDDIPDYFVIFKINDPIDYSYKISVTSLEIGKSYKVLQNTTIDTNASGFQPFEIQSHSVNYSDGNIFTATTFSFTVIQGSGTVILLDSSYNISTVEDTENHFYDKILPKATIVSTSDLSENSNIGKYLRKIKTTSGFTDSLIDVRFEENQLTTFNGVNYSVGVFDKKGDYLSDYYENPETQIGFEDFITNGFRNNGIISYKLLNLEFLFNDSDSENFTINRYFGLYVNAPELVKFKLDGNALFRSLGSSGNSPIPDRNEKGYYFQDNSYFQYNNNGVRIYVDPNYTKGILPSSNDVNISEQTKLFWIKDKKGNFHSLKKELNYGDSSPIPLYAEYGLNTSINELVIQDKQLDLALLTGKDSSTSVQYKGVRTGEKGRAYSVIRIEGELINTNENSFLFYNPFGYYGVPGSKFDILKVSDMSSILDAWGPGSFYSQDNTYYYSGIGTSEDIVSALTGLLNSFNYNAFEAFQSGNELVIRTKATGPQENNKYSLDFFLDSTTNQRMPDSKRGIVFINEKDACDINTKQSFLGGSNFTTTRIKVKIEDANKIEVGKTFIDTVKNTSTDSFSGTPLYSNKSSSNVIGKFRFVDQYSVDENGKVIGLKDFATHATLEISNFTETIAIGSQGDISAFNTFDVALGVFSFYGLREIDMDFWSSQYGHTPTNEYFKHLDSQPDGVTKIVPGKTYFVSSGATIKYPLDVLFSNTIIGPDFFEGVVNKESYELIVSSTGAQSNVIPTLSTRALTTSAITGSNFDFAFYPDLDAFPGFYGIQSLQFINNLDGIDTKFKELNFGKLNSEYDYTQDNFNPIFALKSRVSPYITKWVYRGGTDIRGNGYRLNANIAFSPLNFSPSFFKRTQDPQYFTHEWYHLQKPPFSLPESDLHEDKNYLASELNEQLLSDANPSLRDYFFDYFSIEGEDLNSFYQNSTTIDKIDLTERFSLFNFNSSNGFSDSLYRGAKVKIKRTFTDFAQGESVKFIENDTFYDNYKFSCVIVPVRNIPDEIQAPITIKIIENRTFQNITFIVNVLIEDARLLNFENISPELQDLDLDYFLLYSLKDKLNSEYYSVSSPSPLLINNLIELPTIGDVKLSSGLNVSSNSNAQGFISTVNPSTQGNEGTVYIVPNSLYETDLRDEINFTYLPSVVPSISLNSTSPGSFYGIVGNAGINGGFILPFPTGVSEDAVKFTATDSNYFFDFSEFGLPGPLDIPSTVNFNTVSKIPIYQRQGGTSYFKNILEKISFANLSLLVNTGDSYIQYKSYVWNTETNTTDELANQFSLEFVKPSFFIQESILIPEEVIDKPQELSVLNVGYNISEIEGETELYRYGGEYVPSFREILKFENVKYDLPYWTVPNLFTFEVKVINKLEGSLLYDLGANECFELNGNAQGEINLIKGVSYFFNLSDPSNNGFQLYFSKTNQGNAILSDALTQGYTLFGIPGTPGSFITFDVPYDFPTESFYVGQGGKFMGHSINCLDSIEYLYCSLGPSKDNFGSVKNVNYYKYATNWIFRIGQNSPYNPIYNLIGETPVDKRDLSLFASSWDAGFYREYTGPTGYVSLPGTKNMKEEKSFFGSKVMQTPDTFNSQKQIVYPTSIKDVLNINYNNYLSYEILWENTKTELRGVLLVDRILTRFFLENGGKEAFNNFIIPEFGFGSTSSIDDDFMEYIKLNVLPLFQTKDNGPFLKKLPIMSSQVLTPVVGEFADYQKLINEYYPSEEIRFTKVNELIYEFRIPKNPSTNYSLAFSIKIGKI